jgi:Tol biopolymer transport system component
MPITNRRDHHGLLDEDDELMVAQAVFTGTAGADQFSGTAADDVASGKGGNDELHGAGGDDQLSGGAGDDSLYGDSGNDRLEGNTGADRLDGGEGDDELIGGLDDDHLFGGAGADVLIGNRANDTLKGAQGDDQLFGGAGNDLLLGGDGADLLDGGKGDDRLEGGDGTDTLLGKKGADTLLGGAGADVLDGKLGADVMTGGAGADRFLFTVLGGQVDRVTDLEQGVDQLDLSALLPADLPEGYRLSDYVRFTTTAEGLLVAVDPSGAGASFSDVVLLEGGSADQLTGAELGLPTHHLPIAPLVASSGAGGTVGNGASLFASLSADGRFVTFASSATNLVSGDDGTFDVFRKDLATGEIVKLTEGGNGDSFRSAMSADGEVIAFDSAAGNFSEDDTGQSNVFTATASGEIELASIVNNRYAADPSLSDDGTLLAFTGTATGRAETGDPAPVETITERVFVRDLTDGSLIEASTDANGNYANGASRHGEISGNGVFVVFDSTADNLLPSEDTNPFADVFIKSLADGSIRLVSADDSGNQGYDAMRNPTVSADGRYVAFETKWAFAADDDNDSWDVYLKDMQTGELELISRSADGELGDGTSHGASISADGRTIAFRSAAGNLVDDDGNGSGFDVFVKDLETGVLQRFEVLDDGGANLNLLAPSLSGDGQFVAYVDNVSSAGDGSVTAGQVVVAPVELDTLVTAPEPAVA